MQLNTSHPLYANLALLIGVSEGNQLIDLVTPTRTFTPHASAVFGLGSFGRHFGVRRASYTAYGASISPAFQPANNTGTLIVVTNSVTYVEGSSSAFGTFIGPNSSSPWARGLPSLARANSSGIVAAAYKASDGSTQLSGPTSTAAVGATPRMWTVTRNGTADYTIFVNATPEVTGTALGTNSTNGAYSYIGGLGGYAPMDANIVWIAWLDKVLTGQEVSDLYTSLAANNAFALVTSGGPIPIVFSGTVVNQTGIEAAAFSLAMASYFSGTQMPFAYNIQSGTLPAGLTLSSSSGIISGTPTAASVTSGIVIRATDASANTASTNSFSITIGAATPGNTAPTFDGPNIANISATAGTPLLSLNVSGLFSDVEGALGFSMQGPWPSGLTVSSVGVISGTPTATGTYAGLRVRATDTGGLTADSNTFSITVAAAAAPSTITVLESLKNNTGTALVSQSGVRVAVLRAADLMAVYQQTGLTTNASGVLASITDASITTGQSYHVAIKLADGSVGITGPITAS